LGDNGRLIHARAALLDKGERSKEGSLKEKKISDQIHFVLHPVASGEAGAHNAEVPP